jgi:hypothetical protein
MMMMIMKTMMTMRTKVTTEKNVATVTAAITNSADKHKWPDDYQHTEEAKNDQKTEMTKKGRTWVTCPGNAEQTAQMRQKMQK